MGGILSKPKAPKMQPLPKPDAPIVQGQEGDALTDIKNRLILAGRGGTKKAGPLIPKNVGKKRLLG